jgi:pseudaminic acid synthase
MRMSTTRRMVEIAGRPIGPDHPPYIVAELSGNHNGNIERAFNLLEAARRCGADAVKLQTYTADTITIDGDGEEFRLHGGLWDGRTLHELYREAHTPWEWHAPLFDRARALGLTLFSTAFDPSSVDLLETLDTPAYKLASLEIVDLPLIRRIAATGKPLILSTGAATLGEIDEAVAAARAAGCRDLILLHCTSGYPTPPEESHLATLPHLAAAFGTIVGLSDHTPGTAVPVAAVALGASVIEKHFTLSRSDGGPDSAFSLEPDELARVVADCRTAWKALGRITYDILPSETSICTLRRSLYVVADIAEGEAFSPLNLRSIRPGNGLPPKYLPEVLGHPARRALRRGTPLCWSDVGAGTC